MTDTVQTASSLTATIFATARLRLHGLRRALATDPMGAVGLLILVVFVLAALFAPLIAPHDPSLQSLRDRLVAPVFQAGGSWAHPLGTDNLGRDVLSRIIYGGRASLYIAGMVILIAGSVGIFLGVVAGYVGGRTDAIIMRIADIQIAFPGLLLALTILAVLGASMAGIILVLCLNEWMLFARMARSATLSLRQVQFIEAAEMNGARPRRVVGRHLLPNLAPGFLTLVVLEFANVLLAEAGLSFLGVGVQAPNMSWGLDVATGKAYIFDAWWLVALPGLAIALCVLSANLVASWLKALTNPIERDRQNALRAQAADDRATAAAEAPVGPAALKEASVVDAEAPLLQVDDLSVTFTTRSGTVRALSGVSLSVKRGEVLGLVGESGSGKSVTASTIMGLMRTPGRVTGGQVLWKGRPLPVGTADDGVSATPGRGVYGREISIVFQNPMTSLDALFTVGQQIGEVLEVHMGLSRAKARLRTIELLRKVGITAPEARVDQYPHQLSGGMRQRVLIAMALACEPELLIADEPTTALDVTVQAQILDLLKELQADMGLSVILITHDLGVVARMCDRVAVMYGGRIVEKADAVTLFDAPAHPYTRALLRSTPRLDDRASRMQPIEGTPPDLAKTEAGCAFAARCGRADPVCERDRPELAPIDTEHVAACWLPAPQGARA